MNITERLPMTAIKPNPKKLEQSEVTLNYLNGHVTPLLRTSTIDSSHLLYGDFIVDEPINMIDSNGVILTNIKGIIDNTIFKQCVKCNRVKEMSKFGFRVTDGKTRDQPRCNKCR